MSTKIVVLKMNKLIKIVAFCIVSIAVLGIMAVLFIPKQSAPTAYIAGTYSSEIILNNKPVNVNVTVTKDEIIDVSISSLNETQAVFYPLFEPTMNQVAESVIQMQSTDITLETENTATASILLSAIDNALEKAKK